MNKYTAAIIGCGSIGANKPNHIDYPNSSNILTHANAIDRHPEVELIALVDNNKEQLMDAQKKWHALTTAETYDHLIMSNKVPDIVVVAVPTENHFEVIMNILSHPAKPKLLIVEKPFCDNINQIEEIQDNCETPILVDYIRRFANGYKEIRQNINSGKYGKALNCRILYTRGLRHEGCHAIDLMRYFFGEFMDKDIEDNPYYDVIIDRDENDPTIFAKFSFEKCNYVVFQPCDGRKYGIFEIDICFEETRLRLIDNGLYVEQYHINEENEWGHKSLNYNLTNIIRKETGLITALYNVIDNAVQYLDGNEDLICTIDDALEVQEILSNE